MFVYLYLRGVHLGRGGGGGGGALGKWKNTGLDWAAIHKDIYLCEDTKFNFYKVKFSTCQELQKLSQTTDELLGKRGNPSSTNLSSEELPGLF